jgi:hypothetical protein
MSPGDLEIWLNHFEHHALRPSRVPPALADALTRGESRLIAASIAIFQLGEQSDGRTLLRAAERHARLREMPHLVRIIDLLIREERRHALLLRAFMQDHRIPLRHGHWSNSVFRAARRLGGLELHLSVLISAELIGTIYYRALASATDCRRLQVLCRTLVADELAHIGFESQLLLALRARRGACARALIRMGHRLLFSAAAIAVWGTHRRVLRRAGHGALSFLCACRAQYSFHLSPPHLGREEAGRRLVWPRIEQVGRVHRAQPGREVVAAAGAVGGIIRRIRDR